MLSISFVNNAIIEIPSEAINDVGAFLDAPMSETDTIVYIPDTRRFPDASRLLIGKEIVRYARKLTDRFLDVERGANGTTATTHQAGDYLRHLPEFIAIVPVGPTTIFTTEITSTVIPNQTAVVQSISTIINVESVESIQKEVEVDHQIEVDNTDIIIVPVGTTTSFTSIVTSKSEPNPSILESKLVLFINSDSIESVDKEIDNLYQIEVDNNNYNIIKQIIIIPPTSIEIITNVYSTQSYVSRSQDAAGVASFISVSDARMAEETNRQINLINSINVNLDVITSSQVSTIIENSFDSVSSISTTSFVHINKEIVNFVDINISNNNLIESTNISVVMANTLNAITTISNVFVENINYELKFELDVITDNSNIQVSTSIISRVDAPIFVYTLSDILTAKLAKNADVTKFYKTGSLDYFEEFVVLVNPIFTRTGQVTLNDPINQIITRNNERITVLNKSIYREEFFESYNLGNVGFNLKTFENSAFVDTGLLSNSNTIEELSLAYPSLSIKDFEDRAYSSITLTGEVFNLAPPTTLNPVVYAGGTNLNSSSIINVVGNISKFPVSGYIFQGSSTQYSVINYTGKTTSSFTGCTLISGSSIIDPGNDIIPYFI